MNNAKDEGYQLRERKKNTAKGNEIEKKQVAKGRPKKGEKGQHK